MGSFNSVLLIEDNPGDARLVTEYLSERFGADCRVHGANTLAAGLDVLRDATFDVVLLDLALPDSCGLDTFVRVQAQAPRTPIVILTGDDDDDQASEALRFGAEDYLAKKHANGTGLIRAMRHAVQRRREADELRASEARYRTLVETAEEGILQVNAGGLIRFANARGATILGFAHGDLDGRSLLALVDPAHRAAAGSLLATAPGSRSSCELRLIDSGGDTVWVVAAAGSISALEGEWLELVVMLTDITGRKLAEEELVRLKTQLEARVAERTAQLQAANADLEAFNDTVAHDLRTPLNGILGFATLMQAELESVPAATNLRRLRLIEQSAHSMNELIGGLLSLAKVARQEVAMDALDLSAMARAIADRLAASQPQRQCEWLIDPGVHGFGDATLIDILLQNLLQNAWKYTERAERARIHFGLAQSVSRKPVYFVRDNGVGFDMATAGKLFTPFHRLASARGFAGTGIGLATVRRIVERHGGTVWAESLPNTLTAFFFTLNGPTLGLH